MKYIYSFLLMIIAYKVYSVDYLEEFNELKSSLVHTCKAEQKKYTEESLENVFIELDKFMNFEILLNQKNIDLKEFSRYFSDIIIYVKDLYTKPNQELVFFNNVCNYSYSHLLNF